MQDIHKLSCFVGHPVYCCKDDFHTKIHLRTRWLFFTHSYLKMKCIVFAQICLFLSKYHDTKADISLKKGILTRLNIDG